MPGTQKRPQQFLEACRISIARWTARRDTPRDDGTQMKTWCETMSTWSYMMLLRCSQATSIEVGIGIPGVDLSSQAECLSQDPRSHQFSKWVDTVVIDVTGNCWCFDTHTPWQCKCHRTGRCLKVEDWMAACCTIFARIDRLWPFVQFSRSAAAGQHSWSWYCPKPESKAKPLMENTKEKHHGKHSLKGSPICLRRCFKLFNPATHFTTPEISSDLRYHQLHRLPEGFLFQSLIYPVRKAKQSRDFFSTCRCHGTLWFLDGTGLDQSRILEAPVDVRTISANRYNRGDQEGSHKKNSGKPRIPRIEEIWIGQLPRTVWWTRKRHAMWPTLVSLGTIRNDPLLVL